MVHREKKKVAVEWMILVTKAASSGGSGSSDSSGCSGGENERERKGEKVGSQSNGLNKTRANTISPTSKRCRLWGASG